MIRVTMNTGALLSQIDTIAPGWRDRAAAATKRAKKSGKVAEKDEIWGEIKSVYIEAQKRKCIYCESAMASIDADSTYGIGIDYDVEHFRPKNRVTAWPTAAHLKRRPSINYATKVKAGATSGYPHLAFDPLNYAVSCKICNSTYKRDYFPIAGKPDRSASNKASLDVKEKPFLLLPFGVDGEDPSKLLAFDGPVIRPVRKSGASHLRARVLTDFFELDTRVELLDARCAVIMLLHPQLLALASKRGGAKKATAQRYVDAAQADHPHAACAIAFVRLHGADPAAAKEWHVRCEAYYVSKNPADLGV